MRFPVRLIGLALLVPAAVHANDLMRTYDLAVQNDAAFRAAGHARDAAVEVRPQARAVLLPQITGGYDYGYANSSGTATQAGVQRRIDNEGTDETLSVSLNQSIFSLANWQTLRQASEQVALAQVVYRINEQDLALRVAEVYFGVLSAADALRSTEAENKAVERQLEQAKRRFEVGLSAITDVQEAQARYDLTVANVLQAQQDLSVAQQALAEITGTLPTGLAPLQEDIPLPAPNPANIDAWVQAALESNLDLVAANLNFNIAERGVGVAKARHLPSVALQAGYRDYSSESGSSPQDTNGASVGIGVTLPIFAGGATQSLVRQAQATLSQREAEREGSQRFVERTTRDAYQAVLTNASRVKAFKQAVLSSTTALEASEMGLEVGTRTAVDVLNAQQQLYLAQRTYFLSRYDYLLSVLRLKNAAGKLGARDLMEIDALLVVQG